MTFLRRLSHQSVVLQMDYGQFTIAGSAAGDDDVDLLHHAFASPPSGGTGTMVLVLNPHQSNLAMHVDIETWSSRPEADRDYWQQVSEDPLLVDAAGTLVLGSPTLDSVSLAVEPGDYLLEVSGRGFVNYGWPGSTAPGDMWRLRLWPAAGDAVLLPQRWRMPGSGVPPLR
jgi:hypothetical protein